MAYVDDADWYLCGGHLTDSLSGDRIADLLEGASRFLDRLLRRARPLEPHTATRTLMVCDDGRTLPLGDDRPPAEEERWKISVAACTLYDPYGVSVGTVTPATIVTTYAASKGVLILPTSTSAVAAQVTYTAGYSSDGAPTWTPDIPDALREAAREVIRSLATRDLDQRDPLDMSVAGAAKARAADIAAAYASIPVA